MTIAKKNPNATVVAQGQVDNGVAAINNRIDREESANHGGDVTITVTSTSETINSATIWGAKGITLSEGSPAPGSSVLFTVPAEQRGDVLIFNDMTVDAEFGTSGQSGTLPKIPAGGRGKIFLNGTFALNGGVSVSGFGNIIRISQAAYDALSPADNDTVYLVDS